MGDLVLSWSGQPYDRVMPLITGEVKPAGITLEYQGLPGGIPGLFYEQLKFERYDLSEMSFSSFLVERSKGYPYRLLPVFHNRNFSYTQIAIRKASGIRQDHVEDLKGRSLAVGDYQQTGALWVRGVLQHEFGIHPREIEWVQTRGQTFSHTGLSGSKPPEGVKLRYANASTGDLFLRGEIDSSWGYGVSESSVDRRGADVRGNPEFPLLFTDPKAEAIRYFKKTGIFPPHHTTAVRGSILEKHPWVAGSLMDAFEKAKQIAITRLKNLPPTLMVFGGLYLQEVEENLGKDPFVYGVKANAAAIDMVQTISVEQGLTPKKQALDEIFPEEVLIAEERL